MRVKNDSGTTKVYAGQSLADQAEYDLSPAEFSLWRASDLAVTDIGNLDLLVGDSSSYKTTAAEAIAFFMGQAVSLEGVTIDNNRLLMAENRVPSGYTLYVAGEADDISTGAFGGGAKMRFDSSNTTREFQLLNHSYAIGARVIYDTCSIDNYFDAVMVAPASSGFTNSAGDYDKYALGGGLNMFIPAAPGAGAWTATLTDVLTNTNILKATPVPAAGNTGFFDYDSANNVLTVNAEQTGGYNLYDFDANLHAFGRKVWAQPLNGAMAQLDIPGLVGKLIFNSWKTKFEFKKDGGSLSTEKAALFLIVATKQNI